MNLRIQTVILLGLIALILPWLISDFRVFQVNLMLVYAIAVLGLNLLTGYGGQISLGHGAFYAIGAYTAAILMDQAQWSAYATLPVAALVCLAAGILMGFPALRLDGHYLALATFALAMAIPQLLKYKGIEDYTGGVQGIVLDKPSPLFEMEFLGKELSEDRWMYYLVLIVAVLMFWLANNLVKGRIGRAIVAIRDQPIAAGALGVNLTAVKTLTFGVSAAYTGVAGALGAIAVSYVAPDSFHTFLSISFLVGAVVGGLGTIPGALFGAAFIQFVPNVADEISKSAPWAVYGAILIALIYVAPGGVMGMLNKLKRGDAK
ncbi:MAG: branched-chain amino acid ABC transporter permease [Burkholderiaceae bacterium]|jgi:branched-chain amino acid transport system permease protein|nr:branched-chain amino acid ABC transporter permease [Betaproteobacteria bacterium]MDO7716586.1 branched-chain amino acid ABC transporter permease [Burkholderiaceae bacterium]MDP4697574.1 branched-chain amino acid ABC transporter permease [Burkholderiaceae bacterium]MDP4842053.1 branched-chain amino acid ABC transporter permease [Burkholderiaceae bacterium]MDP4967171.1 branched-chain amino acid ABC transporter permease [Burkholderiaceae bacterium]